MTTSPDLDRLLAEGRLSRREFLARMTAMGAVAAIPTVLASADAMAATPKKGGRLRFACFGGDTADTLYAGHSMCCAAYMIAWHRTTGNALIGIDEGYQPIPELAVSWEATDGPIEWTLELRKGVEFHNGKTFSSEDVLETFGKQMGEDSTSPILPTLQTIAELRADGPDTVVFRLHKPNADFPAVLSAYQLAIHPAGLPETSGIGTGPFVMVDFEPGVRYFAKRNPNYWKEGYPHFDEVEGLHIADMTTKTQALRTGEVDLIDHPDLKLLEQLKKDPDLQIIQVPGTRHYTTPMLATIPPYDNRDVALALKYSVKRQDLVDRVLGGAGTVGNDHPIGRRQRYYNDELPQREFDADKARFHIRKAGMEDHTFKLHASEAAFSGAVDTALLMQASAREAGIKIDVVREPVDGYWGNIWQKKEWCMGYYAGRPTEDWMLSLVYESSATWNETLWKNERFDQLLVEARAELDDAKRREMYHEMQSLVHWECPTVIAMYADQVMAANTRIRTPEKLNGNFVFDGYRFTERWWMA